MAVGDGGEREEEMNPLSHRPGPRKARGASLGCDTGIDKMNPVVQAGGHAENHVGLPWLLEANRKSWICGGQSRLPRRMQSR
jgi:hypothetical protein